MICLWNATYNSRCEAPPLPTMKRVIEGVHATLHNGPGTRRQRAMMIERRTRIHALWTLWVLYSLSPYSYYAYLCDQSLSPSGKTRGNCTCQCVLRCWEKYCREVRKTSSLVLLIRNVGHRRIRYFSLSLKKNKSRHRSTVIKYTGGENRFSFDYAEERKWVSRWKRRKRYRSFRQDTFLCEIEAYYRCRPVSPGHSIG